MYAITDDNETFYPPELLRLLGKIRIYARIWQIEVRVFSADREVVLKSLTKWLVFFM